MQIYWVFLIPNKHPLWKNKNKKEKDVDVLGFLNRNVSFIYLFIFLNRESL